jgi:hypothetical protein
LYCRRAQPSINDSVTAPSKSPQLRRATVQDSAAKVLDFAKTFASDTLEIV